MLPGVIPVVDAHYAAMQELEALAVLLLRRMWTRVDPARLIETWSAQVTNVLEAFTAVQLLAAEEGAAYTSATLDAQGIRAAPEAEMVPAALVGWASDGRPLESLLEAPARVALEQLDRGFPEEQALEAGRVSVERIARTQIADTGRAAAGIDVATRNGVGWVRMVNPPVCSRCLILAGRIYRWSDGFQRHPNCFPAGVQVSGPQSSAATRRWYDGELVILTTASGQQLPVTGNHPVLTRRGWVPANLLNEGDEVVRSARPEGATPLVVPDHHQVPSLIEDVWDALSVRGLTRVPSATEDFHGDGQDGEVDVVYADCSLVGGVHPATSKEFTERELALRLGLAGLFVSQGVPMLGDLRNAAEPGSSVGGSGLGLALLGGHLRGAVVAGGAAVSAGDAVFGKAFRDHVAGDAVLGGEGVFAGPAFVCGGDVGDRQVFGLPRWDAPAGPLTVEAADGYSRRGRDLLDRLAGQVEVDRVVELRRVGWSGHVYSLTSVEGWHTANNLIVSNCDCVHVATNVSAARREGLVDDPHAYFRSLGPEQQDKLLGKAGAQAVRDGADMNQVVNARRGMTEAGTTTEGTTARGFAGKRLASSGQTVRLTPERIYREAISRSDALRLLRLHGYII